jgi:hypothetical protein
MTVGHSIWLCAGRLWITLVLNCMSLQSRPLHSHREHHCPEGVRSGWLFRDCDRRPNSHPPFEHRDSGPTSVASYAGISLAEIYVSTSCSNNPHFS